MDIKTISGYKLKDVLTYYEEALLTSTLNDANIWSIELICSNKINELINNLYLIYFKILYKYDYNIINKINAIEIYNKTNNCSKINDNLFKSFIAYINSYICVLINGDEEENGKEQTKEKKTKNLEKKMNSINEIVNRMFSIKINDELLDKLKLLMLNYFTLGKTNCKIIFMLIEEIINSNININELEEFSVIINKQPIIILIKLIKVLNKKTLFIFNYFLKYFIKFFELNNYEILTHIIYSLLYLAKFDCSPYIVNLDNIDMDTVNNLYNIIINNSKEISLSDEILSNTPNLLDTSNKLYTSNKLNEISSNEDLYKGSTFDDISLSKEDSKKSKRNNKKTNLNFNFNNINQEYLEELYDFDKLINLNLN